MNSRVLKYFILGIFFLSITPNALSYDFEVEGICYEITSFTELTVTATSVSEKTEGFLNVPSFVEFNGKNLKVTKIADSFIANNFKIVDVVIGDSILSIGANAFSNCNELNSITIKGSLNLGSECFKQCKKLTDVNLPSSLFSIGERVFENCESLKQIYLPDQLSQIGNATFANCRLLDNINLSNIENIPNSLFSGCLSLQNIILSENLLTIGKEAFSDTSFETFVIPNMVTTLGSEILRNNTKLKKLTIGSGLKVLSSNPVADCPNIKELIIMDSNEPLTLTFPGSLIEKVKRSHYPNIGTYYDEYIYHGGFEELPIENLYLGRPVISTTQSIGYYNNELLTNPFYENKFIKNVIIGPLVENLPFQEYGYFQRCSSLENVQILGNLRVIGSWMFNDTNIKSIRLPNSVSTIGNDAFTNCSNLQEIFIGKGCTRISSNVFSKCNNLAIINFYCIDPPSYDSKFENSQYINIRVNIPPNTLKEYENSEPWKNFWNLKEDENLITEFIVNPIKYEILSEGSVQMTGVTEMDLEDLSIPEMVRFKDKEYNVTSLAFQGLILENCSEVILPNSIKELPSSIFKDWKKLEHISLGAVKIINDNCFNNCNALNKIIIPSSCKEIGNDCFKGCSELKEIYFESSDTPLTLGYNTSLSLSSSITPFPNPSTVDERRTGFRNGYYDGLFYGLPIENLVINRNIELPKYYERQVGSSTSNYSTVYNDIIYYPPFYGLSELKTVEIGENVTGITKNTIEAFVNAKRTNMQYTNFGNCENITKVISYNPNPPIGGGFTTNVYSNGKLIVPDESFSLYKEAEGWKDFLNIYDISTIFPESIELNENYLSLHPNESYQLEAIVLPVNTTDKTLKWTSQDESIAMVSNDGMITAKGIGTTTISATCGDISAICEVTVTPLLAKKVTLNETSMLLKINETFQLAATVSPENATDKTMVWTSNNESIASVSDTGLVTANGIGHTQIVVSCGEVSTGCEVTVTPILAEELTLNENSISVTKGNTFQLMVTIEPEDVTDKTLVWESDNDKVATVSDDGLVTAVEIGNAKITASCGEVSSVCEVAVTDIDGVGTILSEDEQINVHTVNGVLIKKGISAKELDNLELGTYIIQTPKGSFKIQK